MVNPPKRGPSVRDQRLTTRLNSSQVYISSTFYGARDSGDQNRALCDRGRDLASFELGVLEAGQVG